MFEGTYFDVPKRAGGCILLRVGIGIYVSLAKRKHLKCLLLGANSHKFDVLKCGSETIASLLSLPPCYYGDLFITTALVFSISR